MGVGRGVRKDRTRTEIAPSASIPTQGIPRECSVRQFLLREGKRLEESATYAYMPKVTEAGRSDNSSKTTTCTPGTSLW